MSVRREVGGDLVYIGDVHLDRDDRDLDAFVGFLDRLEPTIERLVLIGDLFNLWIGSPDLEQPHHARIIERLTAMRERGVRVAYIEGNRDFRIKPYHEGGAFDEVVTGNLVERFGGRSVLAAHGDLANTRDTQYRVWRSLSRSRPFWWIARAVPRGRRFAVGEWLENRMRSTNLQQKRAFPEDEVRAYAARYFSEGHDTVVLGHFHIEKDLEARPPSPPGRLFVLPFWRDGYRYLRVTRHGDVRFESG
jgi:UDP-2,3-diacylglucosamine hydrolase